MVLRLSPSLLVVACAVGARAAAETKIAVGAVRWDAWFGAPPGLEGIVGRTVTSDLSPQHYHDRLPFFAKEHAYDPATNSTVDVNGNTPAIMSKEIEYAVDFGISFWAFCAYPLGCADYNPTDCPMIQCCAANYMLSYALKLYLASQDQDKIKFSLILQGNSWYPGAKHGGNETVEQEADRFVSYFRKPNHQVVKGRPVVYLLGGAGDPDTLHALSILVNKTKAALGVSPYLVAMGGLAPPGPHPTVTFDAVTRYVVQKNPSLLAGMPFATGIAEPEAATWESAKEAGHKLIPSISPGWDPSPREYIDLPWGDQGHVACVEKLGHPCYVKDPTMDQLTAHTEAAVKFALDNPATVESGAVIVGAWNENDEGHWIVPSLYNGTQKLEAIRKGVRQAHAEHAQRGV